MTVSEHTKHVATIVALVLLGLYLASGRRWSDEGRLRRRLKGK